MTTPIITPPNNETWFEYFCSFTLGNLGWWRGWFETKTPRPEIVAFIDEITPQIDTLLKTFKDPDRK